MQVDKEEGERRDSCRWKGHKEFGNEVEVDPNFRFRALTIYSLANPMDASFLNQINE